MTTVSPERIKGWLGLHLGKFLVWHCDSVLASYKEQEF